jgi:putative exosortase-associated protein (TIGR04073 family)
MKRKKRVFLAIVSGMLIVGFATLANAENAFDKLGRGVINTASGWLEIPNQAILSSQEYNPFVGITYGQAKGVGMGTYRTGVGVYDAATFLIPPYDATYIEPVYIFGK